MNWTVKRFCGRAGLFHESGWLKIVKYRNHPEAFKLHIPATFHCYYRKSLAGPFGWNVDGKTPIFKSLQEAKTAGETWLKENKAIARATR